MRMWLSFPNVPSSFHWTVSPLYVSSKYFLPVNSETRLPSKYSMASRAASLMAFSGLRTYPFGLPDPLPALALRKISAIWVRV